MKKLDFLEKLLAGAKVAWLPLGKVTDYEQPTDYLVSSSEYSDRFVTPVLTAGKTFVLGYTAEEFGIYKASTNPTIIFDDFTTANKWVDFDFKAKSSAMKMITSRDKDRFHLKYIYYWLNTLPSGVADGDHKRQWISTFAQKTIPIPCPSDPVKSLAIQEDIVRILDRFAELTAELTAELEARKTQYKYYRDKIIAFESGDVAWKSLDEIGEFIRGKRFTKADYVDDGISVIHYGEIYTHYGVYAFETLSKVKSELADSLRYAEKNDVVIAGVSETVEDVGKAVAWLGDEKVAIHDDSFALRHTMNPKFIAYAMQTDAFHSEKAKHVARGKIKRLLIDGIKKVRLPIPYADDPEKSLAEQARIVAILDKFDTLSTSLSEGLPREIELRNRQYEYYRDLLLSFPKPEEMAEA